MTIAMTLYTEPESGLLAIYFGNAGHVIHHKVRKLAAGNTVQFDSDASIRGPRLPLNVFDPRQRSARRDI